MVDEEIARHVREMEDRIGCLEATLRQVLENQQLAGAALMTSIGEAAET